MSAVRSAGISNQSHKKLELDSFSNLSVMVCMSTFSVCLVASFRIFLTTNAACKVFEGLLDSSKFFLSCASFIVSECLTYVYYNIILPYFAKLSVVYSSLFLLWPPIVMGRPLYFTGVVSKKLFFFFVL